jgi:hypothetical protein
MRLLSMFVLACVCALTVELAPAADNADAGKAVTGVLIDQACGSKMVTKDNPEQAAASHPKSCAMKDACEKSGYAVIVGKEMVKFDDNGNKLAKEYLQSTKDETNLRVTVEGTRHGDQIDVTSIKPAA